VHGLAAGDAGRLDLHAAGFDVDQWALAVDGGSEHVDDSSEDTVTNRNGEDLASRLDRLTFLDGVDVAEHHGTDRVLIEVEGEADGSVFETEHLVDGCIRQTANTGDPVADLEHTTNGLARNVGLEGFEILLECPGDVSGIECECHESS